MMIAPEILTAVLGVCSALCMVLVKEVVLAAIRERRASQRTLLQARIEKAYIPLGHLSFMLLRTDAPEQKMQIMRDIELTLRHNEHLLSERAAAICYLLLEDEAVGALLLYRYFYPELAWLKATFYHQWSRLSFVPVRQAPRVRNTSGDEDVAG